MRAVEVEGGFDITFTSKFLPGTRAYFVTMEKTIVVVEIVGLTYKVVKMPSRPETVELRYLSLQVGTGTAKERDHDRMFATADEAVAFATAEPSESSHGY